MAANSTLILQIQANISQASRQISVLNNQVNGIGTSAVASQNLGKSLAAVRPIGIAIAATAVAIDAGLVAAVRTATEFESKMSNVKALLSPDEAKQFGAALGGLALTLGKETAFTPGQAAEGMAELVRAGVSAQSVLDGVGRSALNLAAATGVTVPEAATTAATVMNAFNKTADESTHVMDILAGAANASAADMNDLQYGFAQAGSVARLVGLSFEDTATALALLSNYGIQGRQSGSSLKEMLIRLNPTTKEAKVEMEKLGLFTEAAGSAFYDTQGKIKPLAEIADVLQRSLAGLSDEAKTASLTTIFGTDAVRAASFIGLSGSVGIEKLASEITKIKVADVARTQLDNLGGSIKRLTGSVQAAAINLAGTFTPAIRKVVDAAEAGVNAFASLPPEIQAVAAIGAGAAAIALTLAGAFILLAPSLIAAGPALAGMAAGLASVLGPIGLVAAAFILLGVAYRNNFLGIGTTTNQTVSRIKEDYDIWIEAAKRLRDALDQQAAAATAAKIANAGLTPGKGDAATNLIPQTNLMEGGILGAIPFIGPAMIAADKAIHQAGASMGFLASEEARAAKELGPVNDGYAKLASINLNAFTGSAGGYVAPSTAIADAARQTDAETIALANMNAGLVDAQQNLQDMGQNAQKAAVQGLQPFAREINTIDKQIAGIQLTQLEKAYERISRRPARTPGQQLGRLELQRQILLAKQVIATPLAVPGSNAAPGKSAEVLKEEAIIKAYRDHIKAMQDVIDFRKKMEDAAPAEAKRSAIELGTGYMQTTLAAANEARRTAVELGPTTGYPTPSTTNTTTLTNTIYIQIDKVGNQADAEAVANLTLEKILGAQSGTANAASPKLPGASRVGGMGY